MNKGSKDKVQALNLKIIKDQETGKNLNNLRKIKKEIQLQVKIFHNKLKIKTSSI